jgi:general secretion pathway protein K
MNARSPRSRPPAARPGAGRRRRSQRGAALLVAMILLTLVATLASGMVWQQWRAVQVEIAERGRAQMAWILGPATDWGRLLLREDMRADTQSGALMDDLTEEWATPLKEARLSTFLAADRQATDDADGGPDAFLSGEIVDAQSRYNLRNVVAAGKVVEAEVAVLRRLCGYAGLPVETADRIAAGLLAASEATASEAPLMPVQLDDLAWLGIDPASIDRLRTVAWLLPSAPGGTQAAPINLNTAGREVIAAVLGIDPGSAERLVRSRPFKSLEEAKQQLPGGSTELGNLVAVSTHYFEIHGRMRLDDRLLEERSLVRRDGLNVFTVQRWREHRVMPKP